MVEKNETIFVFGHKNPDTDSICSSIAYSYLLNRLGLNTKPVRLGKLNKETEYVLNKFGIQIPELKEVVNDGDKVILLDHNEKTQTINNIENAEILEVIDHHKINFSYHKPIPFLVRPVGSTCTIIAEMFLNELDEKEFEKEETKKIAGILLAGILSDTLVFNSSTTTEEDIEIAEILSQIAEITDIDSFGKELLKKKSDISDITTYEMITGDSKEFNFNGKKVFIGQLEVLDDSEALKREEEILEELKNLKEKNGYHTVMFMLTNVLKKGSYLFVISDDPSIIEKAFGKKLEKNKVFLENVLSRKKDVVPKLEEQF